MADVPKRPVAVCPAAKKTLSQDEMLNALKNQRSERLVAVLREYLTEPDETARKQLH